MNNDTDRFQAHLEAVAPVQAARNRARNAGSSRELMVNTPGKKLPEDFLVIAAIIIGGAVFYWFKVKGKAKAKAATT